MKIHTVALIGAGAVGSYFIWGLSKKLGENLSVIANGERGARLAKDGLIINDRHFPLNVRTVEETGSVDLILISTKYSGLRGAALAARSITGPHTIILSLLNGVDSEEIVSDIVGGDHVLPSEMQIASRRLGNDIHFVPERTPGVFFGESNGDLATERMQALDEFFKDTPIQYHMRTNIRQDIWLKMAFNVSMNLPQALIGCTIDGYVKSEHMKYLRYALRDEVCTIAAAVGVDITEWSDIEKMEYPSIPSSKYSTLQDLEAGRKTEIDMFSGTLIRLGRKYGIPTPYNEFVYHAIHALEEKNSGLFQ